MFFSSIEMIRIRELSLDLMDKGLSVSRALDVATSTLTTFSTYADYLLHLDLLRQERSRFSLTRK